MREKRKRSPSLPVQWVDVSYAINKRANTEGSIGFSLLFAFRPF